MAATATGDTQELAYRSRDGVDVSLLWNRRTGNLTVAVLDSRTGEGFELQARREQALEVFNHPFAYAAFLGIDLAEGPALAA